MPVTGQPVPQPDPSSGQPLSQIVRPEETVAENCPVLTKLRHVTATKGVTQEMEWQIRTPAGEAIDLTDIFPCDEESEDCENGTVVVRFAACDEQGMIYETEGEVVTPEDGTIRCGLPSQVSDLAGIYRISVGVKNSDDVVVYAEQGLLSVERSLFGDSTNPGGPPTLTEIRMALRDSAIENNLLDAVEFSADEVIFSIVRPIAEWNETPPNVGRYTCNSFPWREAWLKAIIAYLLQTAAFHYTRNKFPASHGGVSIDDKGRDREYTQLAQMFREEWKQWMLHKKIELNVRSVWGGIGSTYRGSW